MPKDEKKKISTLHLQKKKVASLKLPNPPIPTPKKTLNGPCLNAPINVNPVGGSAGKGRGFFYYYYYL